MVKVPRPSYRVGKEEAFYREVLNVFKKTQAPFLIAGTYAVKHYIPLDRSTKDLDIFCKPGDYPKILAAAAKAGFTVKIIDDRWLAKIERSPFYVDLIFGSVSATWPITEGWFEKAPTGTFLGQRVKITPVEELIVSKAYRMRRNGFDGADVAHLLLRKGKTIDWKWLLNRMDQYWEVLFTHIILFRFLYPSQREIIPSWLLEEFLSRIKKQLQLPSPQDKVSRGATLSPDDFRIDIDTLGFRDISDYKSSRKTH